MPETKPPFDEARYRDAASELLLWATYGGEGVTEKSDRYKLVTENRDPGPVYSSCADLAHWMLWRLGVRSKYVNREERTEANGDWKGGLNVSKLAFGPDAVTPWKAPVPKCGDIWIIWSKPQGTDAHVLVVDRLDTDAGVLHSYDYGQAALSPERWKPNSVEGKHCERAVRELPTTWGFPDGRRLHVYLPLWETLCAAQARGELHPLFELPETEAQT